MSEYIDKKAGQVSAGVTDEPGEKNMDEVEALRFETEQLRKHLAEAHRHYQEQHTADIQAAIASGAGCRILAVGLSCKGHTDLPVVRPVVATSWRSVLCRVSCVCIDIARVGCRICLCLCRVACKVIWRHPKVFGPPYKGTATVALTIHTGTPCACV